ncbi:hypothetical protein FLJC2902T_20610 [Flavobacterium limnosediminis JC2902]|uniref:Secretion system C-terminal sorting domain-containing protein n=1 Tax=Flavobacterium limnosediminis JC2902 TaxID=1341181 RepID=V6SL78_9FLAO|nr:T9SS type A sorting domain-containing protein [Flavobacterium limnosediminis]ESU27356.1 hypothetical protein FLJC2902T_20610 [Flavobacterium limnosediminis JC2902]
MKKNYIAFCPELLSGLKTELQMKVALLLFTYFVVFNVQGQVAVTGAVTGNGSYATLGAAFTAIGTSQTGANINIAVSGNTTESAIVNIGAGNWTSVTISPSGGSWTVSGSLASELIRFNGADNVTINGLNTGGNGLTITNTSTSNTDGTSTIKFLADATNNIITNCTVLGSCSMVHTNLGGVVWFSDGTTTGNDDNTISNCNIGPAGSTLPSKLIYGRGMTTNAAIGNSGITITNCNLYDFFLTPSSLGCAAIYATTGNSDWTISNNKIYQTGTRTFTGASTMTMYGILCSNVAYGNNMQITGNIIGYANSAGTGTLTLAGSGAPGVFQGIYLNASPSAVNTCNINNNTISDISLTSSAGGSVNVFYGINNLTTATSNTINVNGNTVRNIVTNTTSGIMHPIFAGSATTLNCSNNTINNISRTGAGILYGISYASSTTVTFNANTISNLSSTSASSTASVSGIYSANSPQNEIFTNNVLSNFSSLSTAAQSIYGIYNQTANLGNKTFQNNSFTNFSLPNTGAGSIYGIRMAAGGTLNEVSGNTVSSFSGGTNIYGISVAAGTTNNVYKNKVYGLSSSVASPSVSGISISGGTTNNIYNNIIGDLTAPSANAANPLNGIYISGGSTANVYYNTVRLNANSVGALFGSSAVYAVTGTTVDFRNNIFTNESTAAGAGLAAAYRRSSTTLTSYASASNNNLFYGSTIFTDGTNTDATLAVYQARVSTRDVASVSVLPAFTSTTGSNPQFLHIDTTVATPIEGGGTPIVGCTNDYDGDVRNATTPDIGADEFTTVLGVSDFALSSLKVYPNPVNDVLQIENSQFMTAIEMYNIEGRKVISKSVNSMTASIPMSEFAVGAYFVVITSDNAVKTVKVVKR